MQDQDYRIKVSKLQASSLSICSYTTTASSTQTQWCQSQSQTDSNQTLSPVPPGGAALDSAIQSYCQGQGLNSAECACMAFPSLAKQFCQWGTVTCPEFGSSSSVCAGQTFAEVASNGIQITQFSKCNPYACWYEPCQSSPEQMLVTTLQRGFQLSGSCSAMCIVDTSNNSITIPTNITPMAPGSVQVNTAAIAQCGSGDSAPAFLTMEPVNVNVPQNGAASLPLTVTNQGDYSTMYTTDFTTLPSWVNPMPSSGTIGPRGFNQISLEANPNASLPVGQSYQFSLVLDYDNGLGETQTMSVPVSVTITAPITPQVQTVVEQFDATYVIAAVILLALVWIVWEAGSANLTTAEIADRVAQTTQRTHT